MTTVVRIAALIGVMATLGCASGKQRPPLFEPSIKQDERVKKVDGKIMVYVAVQYNGKRPITIYEFTRFAIDVSFNPPPGWIVKIKRKEDFEFISSEELFQPHTRTFSPLGINVMHREIPLSQFFTRITPGVYDVPYKMRIWNKDNTLNRPYAILHGVAHFEVTE